MTTEVFFTFPVVPLRVFLVSLISTVFLMGAALFSLQLLRKLPAINQWLARGSDNSEETAREASWRRYLFGKDSASGNDREILLPSRAKERLFADWQKSPGGICEHLRIAWDSAFRGARLFPLVVALAVLLLVALPTTHVLVSRVVNLVPVFADVDAVKAWMKERDIVYEPEEIYTVTQLMRTSELNKVLPSAVSAWLPLNPRGSGEIPLKDGYLILEGYRWVFQTED